MRIAYLNARTRLTQEEEKLKQLEKKKLTVEEELRSLRMNRLDLLKIKQCEHAIEIVVMNIKQQMISVKNAAHRLEVARIRLSDAMVERKTQERLKEKAFDEYLLELEAEDRKEIDERTSFQFSNPTLSEEDS
ncbi:MAG: flagellar export protein FliJ [Mobilitalea sp.]